MQEIAKLALEATDDPMGSELRASVLAKWCWSICDWFKRDVVGGWGDGDRGQVVLPSVCSLVERPKAPLVGKLSDVISLPSL